MARQDNNRIYFGRYLRVDRKNPNDRRWKVSGFEDSEYEARKLLETDIELDNKLYGKQLKVERVQLLYFDAVIIKDSDPLFEEKGLSF